ncbi:MAG TPA: pentapeptide repeat-containing protein [Gemmatimonadaceae bacterium]|nr:pentapeptide repeat-containing protein [Gemmatimonadaceae bacterium]
MIEIKSITGAVLYAADVETLRQALEKAVRVGANLDGASLNGANLDGANLYGANLNGANLDGASLDGANLYGANLYGASLEGASLYGANLTRANLDGARSANVLPDYLKPVREDLRKVLDAAPHEVDGLLAALWAGTIDGSKYEGECACLVGTIANLRHEPHDALKIDLRPDSSRHSERWFLRISKGHTPLTNTSAAFAAAVIAQWQHERASAKPKKRKTQATAPETT